MPSKTLYRRSRPTTRSSDVRLDRAKRAALVLKGLPYSTVATLWQAIAAESIAAYDARYGAGTDD